MSKFADNLYERNGIWWARIQINGRDARRSLRTSDRKQARIRLASLITKADAIRADPVLAEQEKERKWPAAVERWMDTEFVKLREATQRRYETSIRMIHPYWGGLRMSQITAARVSDYATARIKGGASPATVRRDLAVASRVFKIARRAGWVKHDPIPDEKSELSERREPVTPAALRHIAAVIRIAPDGLNDLISFAARTGCRQEEAGSLERRNVNFQAGTITFIKTKTRSPRTIPMTPPVRRILARVLKDTAPPEQPVFRNRDGTRLNGLPSRWRNLVDRADVPHFRFHDLRHTYAIRWLQQGGDIYKLSRRLGHSTVRTTEIYSAWLRRDDP